MDYLNRAQQKSLLESYRIQHCKRFHYMNAAVKCLGCLKLTTLNVTSNALAFYSYRTRCFTYYPDADTLIVTPCVIFSPSSSTSRQCNRFLSEIVRRDGLTVKELQRAYERLDGDETTVNMYQLRVTFDDSTNSVLF